MFIGFALGTWLGDLLTRLYGDFYHFPFLVFLRSPDVYITSAAISFAAATFGAVRATWQAMKLPPKRAFSLGVSSEPIQSRVQLLVIRVLDLVGLVHY